MEVGFIGVEFKSLLNDSMPLPESIFKDTDFARVRLAKVSDRLFDGLTRKSLS